VSLRTHLRARPRSLEALGGEDLQRAAELLDRAGHDVAKYMAMTARNVDAAAPADDEVEMVLRDLRETDGARPAWAVWAPLSRALAGLADDAELEAIDRAMAGLERLCDVVAGDRGRAAELVGAAIEAADGIARLRRRVRARLDEVAP
jgi:hypothetical protein